ncbi:DUF1861 family protein [Paenibacillus sp. OAS669]|uniref:DUF1861 family protein n=1 Tax=Paenibacillus sp. OAS669 TaxID=2663821 RepID=UPI00298F3BDE|nr:DUF1861 family protein [Paenibacillus sp. OAS669]
MWRCLYSSGKTLGLEGQQVHFDPTTRESSDLRLIGSRLCYPPGPAKAPHLVDCIFTSGIVMRPDGKAGLYSGTGDCQAGRITIDYPFERHGRIV